MAYTKFSGAFKSHNERSNCAYYIYTPISPPKAILQIVHGMREYVERYEHFIEYLTDAGYLVCGEDHIGHGRTAENQAELGIFPCDDADEFVENAELLRLIIRKKYRSLPYIMLGHSLGSFIARRYSVMYGDNLDGMIILGTSAGDAPTKTASLLLKFLELIKGANKRLTITKGLGIKAINGHFAAENDDFSWVTRDPVLRDHHRNDPMSNFDYSIRGFKLLISLLRSISDESWAEDVPKSLPILISSGDEDPIGNYGAGVKLVYERLEAAEICDLTLKLYHDARHELLFEINRDEVYSDILAWLDRVVDGANEARMQNISYFGG